MKSFADFVDYHGTKYWVTCIVKNGQIAHFRATPADEVRDHVAARIFDFDLDLPGIVEAEDEEGIAA